MKKIINAVLLVLAVSSCNDRTKIELKNGKGEPKEVSTLGLKFNEFDYDEFVIMAKMASSIATFECENYLTYEPQSVFFDIWGEKDTKTNYDYKPTKETFIILVSFTGKNSFGIEKTGMKTCYFQKENETYKSVTKEIQKYIDTERSEEVEKEMKELYK